MADDMTSPVSEKECSAAELSKAASRDIRVLLADDNPFILEAVCDLLQPEFIVMGAVTDGETALREALRLDPDLVILDISMGKEDGISVARRLKEAGSPTKVVFLTVHEFPEFIRAAMDAGGSAYVFKSRLRTDLIPAIQDVCAGRCFVSQRGAKS
jgi:two-component system, NarL family, response regulator DegU